MLGLSYHYLPEERALKVMLNCGGDVLKVITSCTNSIYMTHITSSNSHHFFQYKAMGVCRSEVNRSRAMSSKTQSSSPIVPSISNANSLRWDHSATSRLSDQSLLDSVNVDNFEMIRLQLEKKIDETQPVWPVTNSDPGPVSINTIISPFSITVTENPSTLIAPVAFDTALFGTFTDDLTWDENDIQSILDINSVNDAMDDLITRVIRRVSTDDNDTSADTSVSTETKNAIDDVDGHELHSNEKKIHLQDSDVKIDRRRSSSTETVSSFLENDMDSEGFKSWQTSHRWSSATIKHLLEALQQ